MLIGLIGDTHDNLDRIRDAVTLFNAVHCEHVLFVGDLVSPIALPPFRKLSCKMTGCFGDNEGNRPGILSGIAIIGTIDEAPVACELDGLRFVLVHSLDQLQGYTESFDVAVYSHTHRAKSQQDTKGRWFINPGEAGGWVFGKPTVGIFDTTESAVEIVDLREAHKKWESDGED
jgi:putative phosphoesterase